MDLSKNGFYSPTKGSVTAGVMLDEIRKFVKEDKKGKYNVIIGSDSQIKFVDGKKQCDFVTAIIIYRKGRGGKYFYRKEKILRAPQLKEKIYNETQRSIETANELIPHLNEYLENMHFDFEIHIDVGEVGKTKEVINEVVGMVSGYGYIAKIKPYSWGASTVADKHT